MYDFLDPMGKPIQIGNVVYCYQCIVKSGVRGKPGLYLVDSVDNDCTVGPWLLRLGEEFWKPGEHFAYPVNTLVLWESNCGSPVWEALKAKQRSIEDRQFALAMTEQETSTWERLAHIKGDREILWPPAQEEYDPFREGYDPFWDG